MQREYDSAIGEHLTHVQESFHTEVDVMMEMHDLRLQCFQQLAKFSREARVGIRELEPVKGATGVQILAIGKRLADRCTELLIELITHAAEEAHIEPRPLLERREEFVGRD